MLRTAFCTTLALLLAGCGANSTTVCPPLRSYSQTFSDQLADEIESAPAGAAFPVAVEDYVGLRDQLRAACSR